MRASSDTQTGLLSFVSWIRCTRHVHLGLRHMCRPGGATITLSVYRVVKKVTTAKQESRQLTWKKNFPPPLAMSKHVSFQFFNEWRGREGPFWDPPPLGQTLH